MKILSGIMTFLQILLKLFMIATLENTIMLTVQFLFMAFAYPNVPVSLMPQNPSIPLISMAIPLHPLEQMILIILPGTPTQIKILSTLFILTGMVTMM